MLSVSDFPLDSIFLGVDFGTKRIGIASGQQLTATATPLQTLVAKNGVPSWAEFDKIVFDWKPKAMIVGIPLDLDGHEQWISKRARNFMKLLAKRYQLPVYGVPEQFTTKSAREKIFDLGGYKALEETKMDSVAAKLILEDWLRSKK